VLNTAHAQQPEVVYRPTDALYAVVEDGDLLYASALVDAGACPWVIAAQISEATRETDDVVEMNTIVMAERATEAEAVRERDRRNGLKDARLARCFSKRLRAASKSAPPPP
jgi:hypothetical protein